MTTQKKNKDDIGLTLEDWRRLHAAAAQVRALEPWLWMEEDHIFGVQDTQSDQVLFVSVSGMLGEHFAVAVYPGASELARYQLLAHAPEAQQPDLFFDMRQILVSFGKKSDLHPQEKTLVKQLGLTLKGANAWPSFRSYRPGFFPWVVDAVEARWILLAMEQLLVVAPRIAHEPSLVFSAVDKNAMLTRMSDAHLSGGWRDEFLTVPSTTHRLQIHIPPEQIGAVRFLPQQALHLEVDVFPLRTPTGPLGVRQQLPYMLMVVDTASMFVLGFEMLFVQSSLEDMWLEAPAKLLKILEKNKLRPASLTVQRFWLGTVLHQLCVTLDIALRSDPLSVLPEVRRDMEQMLRG